MAPAQARADRVAALRAFNRFFTLKIGVLNERHLKSPFSLAEARVLYELAHRDEPTATDIASELGLDAGYLSRILRRFERAGLVQRAASKEDARRSLLRLTAKGRTAYAALEAKSQSLMREVLQPLAVSDQERLLANMRSIEAILGAQPAGEGTVALRTHLPGDMGWIVSRHGELYAKEFGWDERFEAHVAKIAAEIIEHFDPARERVWIAERNGERIGSACIVVEKKSVARLRLVLIEPSARGLGLGHKLVQQCIDFSRGGGYRRIVLDTQSMLYAARHIYEKAGFRLTGKKKHRDFGIPLTGETWELEL